MADFIAERYSITCHSSLFCHFGTARIYTRFAASVWVCDCHLPGAYRAQHSRTIDCVFAIEGGPQALKHACLHDSPRQTPLQRSSSVFALQGHAVCAAHHGMKHNVTNFERPIPSQIGCTCIGVPGFHRCPCAVVQAVEMETCCKARMHPCL